MRIDEHNTLEHSGERIVTHRRGDCKEKYCTIHNKSNHHMRNMPQHFRYDRGIIERICSHGVGHPDPDQYDYWGTDARWQSIHGCDGCCVRETDEAASSK